MAPPAAASPRELRLYGFNAVRALFARRPEALRRPWLAEARVADCRDMLKWCAAHRVGYRIVAEEDLRKLAASGHHEGIVVDVLRPSPLAFADWLAALPAGPVCVLWLDGVGNPHNLGAILRRAAHFGVAGLLLPAAGDLQLSAAAARLAEDGAEVAPLVRMGDAMADVEALHRAGFVLAATLVEGGGDLFASQPPARIVYVMGGERTGVDRGFAGRCDLRLFIPGSGAVERLDVAAATAVLLAAWARGVSALPETTKPRA
ncbi:rRNA methyltransferase [Lysobacter pythonis]|uniref:rRNA methyltransferase n=1 Tax=Solilutibacter pythonis TaxID=2483112 RepID=A0A3M2HUE1_9GAMM|nr:TrmH family RNA methyltransferase [Lysobacter pythonis]RMH91029.1 rRNA methyltransferase [Lysobacter pythonis]